MKNNNNQNGDRKMSFEKKQPIWTKSFIGVFMTQLSVFMVFYALITTLPLYVINHLGGSGADGGLVVTAMLVSAILIRLFSATILDIVGMKKGLILGVAAFALTTCVYIWVNGFISLLVLRFIHGLSFGFLSTATGAIAANVVPRERHGEGIGYFAMSANLAVVLGPFVGLSLLQYIPYQTLFIVLSILTIAAVLFAAFVQVEHEKNAAIKQTKQKFSINDFIETKAISISLIGALTSFVYASIISFVSVYSDSIGLSETASYFFLIYAAAMIISRPYFGKKFDRHGPNYVIIPGLLLFAAGLAMLSFTESSWMLILSAAIIGLGFGTLTPSFQTMAVQSTHPSRSGHATATFFTMYETGIATGSFVLGLLGSHIGFQMLYTICAFIILAVMGIYLIFQRRKRKQEHSY